MYRCVVPRLETKLRAKKGPSRSTALSTSASAGAQYSAGAWEQLSLNGISQARGRGQCQLDFVRLYARARLLS